MDATSFFHQPYPVLEEKSAKWAACAILGSIVFLLLLIFQPFGLSDAAFNNVLLQSIIYGSITFVLSTVIFFLFPLLFPAFYQEEKWTVGREIVINLVAVMLISVGNWLFVIFKQSADFSLPGFLYMAGITFVVSIFPVTALVLLKYISRLKKYSAGAAAINREVFTSPRRLQSDDPIIQLPSQNRQENFEIDSNQLLYIQGADNYARICYLENGSPKIILIRNTLKNLEKSLAPYPVFYRCHRSYLVNLEKVISVSGNAQGYKLQLSHIDQNVPVSRNFGEELKAKLIKFAPKLDK